MKSKSRYEQRGVSATKTGVHKATENLDKGLYPGAFCKILPDIVGGGPYHCNLIHADTAGTKAGLAWLMWKITGDLKWFKNIAQCALVMNLDDAGCVGIVDNLVVNQTIGRNSFLVPDEGIKAIIEGADALCTLLSKAGINCHFGGGETADVPDIVRTLDVGSSLFARIKRSEVIDASRMAPGDVIVGFSSTGRANWESEENSGIGANGLTNARHDVLRGIYRRYREAYAPQIKRKLVYRGEYRLTDKLPDNPRFTIGEALLSPTRTYLPLIKKILENIDRRYVHGIIHCSGGGQTKIGKFGHPQNVYVKDDLFVPPALFQMLQKVSGLSWREMYGTYNMGHRLEMVFPDREIARDAIAISDACGIHAKIVGRVVPRSSRMKNRVIIDAPYGCVLDY